MFTVSGTIEYFKRYPFKMEVTSLMKRSRKEGQILPAWWYGQAYIEPDKAVEVFYPIPINYIIRFGRMLKYRWDVFRSRPTWIDREAMKIKNKLESNLREKDRIADDLIKLLRRDVEILSVYFNKDGSVRPYLPPQIAELRITRDMRNDEVCLVNDKMVIVWRSSSSLPAARLKEIIEYIVEMKITP